MSARNTLADNVDVRAEMKVLERNPPVEIFQRRLELRRRPTVMLMGLLSVVLLTVSFPPFDLWFVAYVALVPWLMALVGGTRRRWAIFASTVAGFVFWAINLYWLTWITLVGYVALIIYLTSYWLAAAVVLRAAYKRNLPMWLSLPIVWVGLEFLRAYVISGFPWFYLAHSQYARSHLIQIADLTGQYGLSFFVAMVNGAIADMLTYPLFVPAAGGGARMTRQIVIALAASMAACAVLVAYGSYRLGQDCVEEGPIVGIVQEAFPVTLRGRDKSSAEIFNQYYADSRRFVGAGCDLVIWPETMLPSGMNREFLDMDPNFLTPRGQELQRELRDDANRLAELSKRLGCPILAGGTTLHRNSDVDDLENFLLVRNSALWFNQSDRPSRIYSKMHLVPFGEYVPFKESWPALHKALRWFVPPVMEQLEPGRITTIFELNRPDDRWTLATPICYEGTFADVCRNLVMHDGRKEVDILANMSNDGWFVCDWGGSYRPSTEHPQHLVQYCFRAVENRVPVVRAVNTGISGSIDSSGRIVSLVEQDGRRGMACGTLLLDGAVDAEGRFLPGHGPKVLVDSRVSLYSLVGNVFAWAVSLAGLCLVSWLVWRRIRDKRIGNEA